jgi:hypothetical protein
MSNYHCLDIEFLDIDLASYYIRSKVEVSKVHHVHLYTSKDEIELKNFFDDQTYFGEKFVDWLGGIDRKKFGSFLKVEVTKNHTNEGLQKLDFSEAKLLGFKNSTNYYENGKKYILISVDTVKFYWNPVDTETHTAEFYLDDKGFRIVEPFYLPLFPKSFFKNDGEFEIRRVNGSNSFYELTKFSFRLEYSFSSTNNSKERVASITKHPKIQFKYINGITEKEAIFYGDIVLMLASFYHHIKIDYITRRIHLPENTITIKNIEQKNFIDTNGNLSGFEINWDFNKFLQSSQQKEVEAHFTLLSKVIALFNQSHLVDSHSKFLIRYNIIEICDKQKRNSTGFKLSVNKKERKAKQGEALEKLLETIDPKEHEEFKKRWQDVLGMLNEKPMGNQLILFLESQNLNPKAFPLKISDLKRLRNDLVHGSTNVDPENLRKANILLYRINGILILNLMGIKEWKLNTEIN